MSFSGLFFLNVVLNLVVVFATTWVIKRDARRVPVIIALFVMFASTLRQVVMQVWACVEGIRDLC